MQKKKGYQKLASHGSRPTKLIMPKLFYKVSLACRCMRRCMHASSKMISARSNPCKKGYQKLASHGSRPTKLIMPKLFKIGSLKTCRLRNCSQRKSSPILAPCTITLNMGPCVIEHVRERHRLTSTQPRPRCHPYRVPCSGTFRSAGRLVLLPLSPEGLNTDFCSYKVSLACRCMHASACIPK